MNFKIDEKSTIGSILEALKVDGVKTGDVAKAIKGISEKPLRNALKQAGYEFQNKIPKGWHYIGEGEPPLHNSIFDYVKQSNMKVKDSSPKVIQANPEVNSGNIELTPVSPIVHPQFTRDEVEDLVAMLQEWRMNKAAAQLGIQEPKTIHARIKELPQGDKIRKTIVINKAIGERLDAYCQAEKVNKSDILHLALMDFFDRQEKIE